MSALVAVVREINTQVARLEEQLAVSLLGEFGDDPDRCADAKARKNYAGTSPITKASSKSTVA